MSRNANSLDSFHRFRRIPELVGGGTAAGAVADGEGRVVWTGRDGARRAVDLLSGTITDLPPAAEDAVPSPVLPEGLPSSDGQWLAGVVDHNIVLTKVETGDKRKLTTDGTAEQPWSPVYFTGDAARLIAARADTSTASTYPFVDWLSSSWDVTQIPHMHECTPSPVPPRLALIDTATAERTWIQERGRCDLIPRWASADGRWVLAVAWDKVNTIELVRIDTATGDITALMSDRVANTVPYLYACLFASLAAIPSFDGLLWASDRDGDLRLYAVPADGTEPSALTPPGVQLSQPTTHLSPMPILTLEDTIVLMAHTDPTRPYDVHACITDLSGNFRVVTDEPGVHAIASVPGTNTFLDYHSSHTRAPRTDLRRADGALLATLEVSDVSEVEALGRTAPEEFTVKAADGVTDLHGLLFKPADFDPAQSYPLIDIVYGGPHQIIQSNAYVTAAAGYSPFTDWTGLAAAFTRLGFVGVVLDGRGTPGRGRAFQEAAALDFPNITAQDHAAAITALAADRPWIDASRCGVLGHSFGGYHAVRCGLNAPTIFRAVVSAAGAFEPAIQDRTFAEGLFGVSFQDDPEVYAQAGCCAHAKRFEPELLIIAGTHDTNVVLGQAMRFSDALTLAGKHHDLVILQGKDHALNGVHGDYAMDRAARFFLQHLGAP